jgi:hypothetical protein
MFAVESISRWWRARGSRDCLAAARLLITADAGGSNGYRYRVWKSELAALAAETGLAITVCHFPPGTGLSRERCFWRFGSVGFSGRPAVTERDGEAFPFTCGRQGRTADRDRAGQGPALTARWG